MRGEKCGANYSCAGSTDTDIVPRFNAFLRKTCIVELIYLPRLQSMPGPLLQGRATSTYRIPKVSLAHSRQFVIVLLNVLQLQHWHFTAATCDRNMLLYIKKTNEHSLLEESFLLHLLLSLHPWLSRSLRRSTPATLRRFIKDYRWWSLHRHDIKITSATRC